jgi:DNA-binding HxlR family transcriptional regulator
MRKSSVMGLSIASHSLDTTIDNTACPVARTAKIISGKWTLLIIRDLASGVKRFNQLERSLSGISPKTLSERLRALEEEGVIHRQTFAEVPPRVEYSLTEKGRDLVEVVECMRCYGKQWLCDAPDE